MSTLVNPIQLTLENTHADFVDTCNALWPVILVAVYFERKCIYGLTIVTWRLRRK